MMKAYAIPVGNHHFPPFPAILSPWICESPQEEMDHDLYKSVNLTNSAIPYWPTSLLTYLHSSPSQKTLARYHRRRPNLTDLWSLPTVRNQQHVSVLKERKIWYINGCDGRNGPCCTVPSWAQLTSLTPTISADCAGNLIPLTSPHLNNRHSTYAFLSWSLSK